MPPKARINKEDIVNKAICLIQSEGVLSLNARSLASKLNCSTQPIFSNFATMDDLQQAVILSVYNIYLGFIKNEVESNKYPRYKAFGMAYIRFAQEEKELFKLLFMHERKKNNLTPTVDFNESVEMIMIANNVSKEIAELMHMEMWACVHGIGTMLATSFCSLEWDYISNILTDVYQGIRLRHVDKEN